MQKNRKIFSNCEIAGAKVITRKKEDSKSARLLDSARKQLSKKIRENLIGIFSEREKEFLNLQSSNHDNKTLLEVIIDNCYIKKSSNGKATYFIVNKSQIEISKDEINGNGFSYELGRRHEIHNLVKSIFTEKIGVPELFSDFNHGSNYCFYLSYNRATFNLRKI